MDAMNVEKHSPSNLVSSYTKELTQVRNVTDAVSARKLSPTNLASFYIRKLIKKSHEES